MDPEKQEEGVGDEGFHTKFVKSQHWELEWALSSLRCLEHSATQFFKKLNPSLTSILMDKSEEKKAEQKNSQ